MHYFTYRNDDWHYKFSIPVSTCIRRRFTDSNCWFISKLLYSTEARFKVKAKRNTKVATLFVPIRALVPGVYKFGAKVSVKDEWAQTVNPK